MNLLEMAEEIAKKVPLLAKRDKDEWKNAKKLRARFVADYPISKIRSMSLDEYVIGKGSNNRSFCYRLEREMDSLGRILGANAFKFGVYYGRTKSDPSERYRFSSIWGSNAKEAFTSVRDAIVHLLEDADRGDRLAIAKSRLSPMFKGKILFIYFPDQFAPIYSKQHLEHFLAKLDISGSFNSGTDMQRALMEYRARWPALREQPVPLYMRLLYDIFGHPEDDELRSGESNSLPLLDDAMKGAEFIPQMPTVSSKKNVEVEKLGKIDHEKHQRQLKRIGDRGEAIVVALEKNRLIQAGKFGLASRVKHVSQQIDSAGYDILSFDEDGTARYIEVKATSASNLGRGFYISSNEFEKAKVLQNYYIYFVFSALGRKPQILPVKQPALNGSDFKLHPVIYHVTLSGLT